MPDIARLRMHNQLLSRHPFRKPEQVVAYLGAMQAQDYAGALWAVAQRTPGATRADVELAITEKRIVRSWPMRGTLHFMAGTDARWMLELLTPRANASGGWATRRKFLGISDRDMARAGNIVERALAGGKILERRELYAILDRSGVSSAKQRGLHILSKLAHELLIIFGPHRGAQATFALLDEWLPKSPKLDRDDALARLATVYFTSHGPATIRDFTWWSSLTVADAKRGIAAAGRALKALDVAGVAHWSSARAAEPEKTSEAHLLPPFDEMLVAYRDRSASLSALHRHHMDSKNGFMHPTVMVDGQVVGTWGRTTTPRGTNLAVMPFFPFPPAMRRAIAAAAERYSHYLGTPVFLR